MLPFKVKRLHTKIFFLVVFSAIFLGACDSCSHFGEDGCDPSGYNVGCFCKEGGDPEVKTCKPGGCLGEDHWDSETPCSDAETKQETCDRVAKSENCDGTIKDHAPVMTVAVVKPKAVYNVNDKIIIRITVKDDNSDVDYIHVNLADNISHPDLEPENGEDIFTIYPIVREVELIPKDFGCYKTSFMAHDKSILTDSKDLYIPVGAADVCTESNAVNSRKKPEYKFASPRDGESFPSESKILLSVSGRAPYGDKISKVEFLVDSRIVETKIVDTYEGTFEYSWTPAKSDVGKRDIIARFTLATSGEKPEAKASITIAEGVANVTKPAITLPASVITMGRMFSADIIIPTSAGNFPINSAAVRLGGRYSKIMDPGGLTAKIYADNAAMFNTAQLDNPGNVEFADFLVVKNTAARSFRIYGMLMDDEYANLNEGKVVNLTLELEGGWDYPIALLSSKGNAEKIAKDKIFNDLIDFAFDFFNREDPAPPVNFLAKTSAIGLEPDAIRYLVMKSLSGIFTAAQVYAATELNLVVGYIKGIFEGLWSGVKDDYGSLKELISFIRHPIDRSFELYNGIASITELIRTKGMAEFVNGMFASITNSMQSFLSTADQSVVWRVEAAGGLAIEVGLRAYIAGYVTGYLTEQLASAIIGYSVAAKIGKSVALVMETTRVGKVVIAGVSAANKFNKSLLNFASRNLQLVKELKTVAQGTAKMKEIQTVIKEFSSPATRYADKLGGSVTNWRAKFNALAYNTAGDWAGKARNALIRMTEVNEMKAGQTLSDAAATGYLGTYPYLADLEELVPGFNNKFIGEIANKEELDIAELNEVLGVVDELPFVPVITPGSAKGIKIKSKVDRLYWSGEDFKNKDPFTLHTVNEYRFTKSGGRIDVYFGDHFVTSYYEVRGNLAHKRLYRANMEVDNILDLTDPNVLDNFIVDGAPVKKDLLGSRVEDPRWGDVDNGKVQVYGYTQKIADEALAQGYNGIWYPSAQSPKGFKYPGTEKASGNCLVVFQGRYDKAKFTQILNVPVQ